MKLGKATGPDSISVELLKALEDYGIDKIATLLTKIYDTVQILPYTSESIFITLLKKLGATECELSHITKIILRITMMLVGNKIKPEIAEEQCGFFVGRKTQQMKSTPFEL